MITSQIKVWVLDLYDTETVSAFCQLLISTAAVTHWKASFPDQDLQQQ